MVQLQVIEAGEVPEASIDDKVARILRSMIAVGAIDNPPLAHTINPEVLLKTDGLLPLASDAAQSVVLIGGHADSGVLSGGGSSAVWPVGGPAAQEQLPGGLFGFGSAIWHPSSPL
ncbi:MAG: glycosyl hydrolase, partial [Rhodanobacter sp.]